MTKFSKRNFARFLLKKIFYLVGIKQEKEVMCLRILAKSDIGKTREMNQDSFFVSEETDEIKIFILADGMGGYKGGEIASKLAVHNARSFISNNFKNMLI